MSFLYRLPLSNFPSVLHHIQPGVNISKTLSSEPVGVLGQSPSLCNRINPVKPVEINEGANRDGPGSPLCGQLEVPPWWGVMLEPAPTSGEG